MCKDAVPNGSAFHPDFTPPVNGVVLHANDDTRFWFDFNILKSCSSFFNDLGDMPLHTAEGEDYAKAEVIPLLTATGDGLALTLNLVRDHKSPYPNYRIPWPSSATILNFLDICQAYDLPLAIESFLLRTVKVTSPSQCFERLVVASSALARKDYQESAYGMVMLHGLHKMNDWAKDHLRTNPSCAFELYRRQVDLNAMTTAAQSALAECCTVYSENIYTLSSVLTFITSGILPSLLLQHDKDAQHISVSRYITYPSTLEIVCKELYRQSEKVHKWVPIVRLGRAWGG